MKISDEKYIITCLENSDNLNCFPIVLKYLSFQNLDYFYKKYLKLLYEK